MALSKLLQGEGTWFVQCDAQQCDVQEHVMYAATTSRVHEMLMIEGWRVLLGAADAPRQPGDYMEFCPECAAWMDEIGDAPPVDYA